MLITIAICEDEESVRKDLADKLNKFAANHTPNTSV